MTSQRWRLLLTGPASGPRNMALDEAILLLHAQSRIPPTLRLYEWHPPCISIGYFQSVQEVDLERCREWGLSMVRRPTGGRAVLHEEEVAYSLVALQQNPLVSGGITESYHKISQALVEGLRRLGLAAKAEPGARLKRTSPTRSPACFDAISPYEVTIEDRKVVGSAQVRRQGALLQHGSILLGLDGAKLFSLLRTPQGERDRMVAEFRRGALSLEEALGRKVQPEEVIQSMLSGFEAALGIELWPGDLTQEEDALARELSAEKYEGKDWTFRR